MCKREHQAWLQETAGGRGMSAAPAEPPIPILLGAALGFLALCQAPEVVTLSVLALTGVALTMMVEEMVSEAHEGDTSRSVNRPGSPERFRWTALSSVPLMRGRHVWIAEAAPDVMPRGDQARACHSASIIEDEHGEHLGTRDVQRQALGLAG